MSDLDFKFNVGDDEFTFINGGVTPTAVLPQDVKSALLECFRNVAWANANGPDCYARLEAALNAVKITSISAVYTQSGTVYDTDSLDSLKADLVVTAYYDDGTSADVTSASVLSGTLTEGTSTITVTYSGKTATFNVTVTGTVHIPDGTYTYSDGTTITVSNNHITAYLATYSKWRFINLSNMSDNASGLWAPDSVNNKSTSFLSLSEGETLTLEILNASTDNTAWGASGNTYDIAVNMRKQNESVSVFSPAPTVFPASITTPGHSRTTEASASVTVEENTVASNVFLYIAQRYPAKTTFECDVRIIKE